MKKTRLARKRKARTPIEITKDKAWAVFARWIRNRDVTCVTCKTGKADNAGHFWHGVLDFDEENINGQCVHCNMWMSGNLAPYSVYLLNKLGKEKFDALNIRHSMAMKGDKKDLQYYLDIISKYSS